MNARYVDHDKVVVHGGLGKDAVSASPFARLPVPELDTKPKVLESRSLECHAGPDLAIMRMLPGTSGNVSYLGAMKRGVAMNAHNATFAVKVIREAVAAPMNGGVRPTEDAHGIILIFSSAFELHELVQIQLGF